MSAPDPPVEKVDIVFAAIDRDTKKRIVHTRNMIPKDSSHLILRKAPVRGTKIT